MSKAENMEEKIDSKGKKLNIKINLCQSEEDPINSNKTEESLFNEKSESVDLNKINKKKEINNINNKKLEIDGGGKEKEKEKKVKFLEPEFVQIIEVESYKKYNVENTSKDPYFADEKKENKANVMCSCFIF